MFFLPLPLDKTLQTLDEVEDSNATLASPELYIIVNGRPTKKNVRVVGGVLGGYITAHITNQSKQL